MMARSNLKLVGDRQPVDVREPEDVLGYLFAREAQLTAELADVRRQQIGQRKRYAERHGLRMYPGMETLRDLYGPRRDGELR